MTHPRGSITATQIGLSVFTFATVTILPANWSATAPLSPETAVVGDAGSLSVEVTGEVAVGAIVGLGVFEGAEADAVVDDCVEVDAVTGVSITTGEDTFDREISVQAPAMIAAATTPAMTQLITES